MTTYKHMTIALVALLTAIVAVAAPISIGWDHSEADCGYKLYVYTNSLNWSPGYVTNRPLTLALMAINDCGTNRQMSISGLGAGGYWIGVAAYRLGNPGVLSDWPRTNIVVDIPSAPERTMILESGTDLTFTNAETIRFFRLRFQ